MVRWVQRSGMFKIRVVLANQLVEGRVCEVVVRVNSASMLCHTMVHDSVLALAMSLVRVVHTMAVAHVFIPAIVAMHRLCMSLVPRAIVTTVDGRAIVLRKIISLKEFSNTNIV